MKIKIALSLLVATALLPACTTTVKTTSQAPGSTYALYAANQEPAPPAEGPEADIPSEGPSDVNANPAYIPTPLLRGSAAASP